MSDVAGQGIRSVAIWRAKAEAESAALGRPLSASRSLGALRCPVDGAAPNAVAGHFPSSSSYITALLRIHPLAHDFQVLRGLGATFADYPLNS
jgi:hypothetical protein